MSQPTTTLTEANLNTCSSRSCILIFKVKSCKKYSPVLQNQFKSRCEWSINVICTSYLFRIWIKVTSLRVLRLFSPSTWRQQWVRMIDAEVFFSVKHMFRFTTASRRNNKDSVLRQKERNTISLEITIKKLDCGGKIIMFWVPELVFLGGRGKYLLHCIKQSNTYLSHRLYQN